MSGQEEAKLPLMQIYDPDYTEREDLMMMKNNNNRKKRKKNPKAKKVSQPKRKRGRPRKDPDAPPNKKRKSALGKKSTRSCFVYPDWMSDPAHTGWLRVSKCFDGEEEKNLGIIKRAEEKRDRVLEGKAAFGWPVVIPSFNVNTNLQYDFPATLPLLFALHTLFTPDVMLTRHGKVSVFPVQVFRKEGQKVGGYPCMAIHRMHFRTLMAWMKTNTQNLITKEVLTQVFKPYCCYYDADQDASLMALSGFDPYTLSAQREEGSFMLLPAHWLDAVKYFFVDADTMKPKDLGFIFRQVYGNKPNMGNKFLEQFRAIWMGDERQSNVNHILKIKDKTKRSFGGTRCRVFDNQVKVGGFGKVWSLPKISNKEECEHIATRHPSLEFNQDQYQKFFGFPPGPGELKKPKVTLPDYHVLYTSLSFAYGIECWDAQLAGLLTMHQFFSDDTATRQTVHLQGFLVKDRQHKEVKTREACRQQGLLEDPYACVITTKESNKKRNAFKSKHGAKFVYSYFLLDDPAATDALGMPSSSFDLPLPARPRII